MTAASRGNVTTVGKCASVANGPSTADFIAVPSHADRSMAAQQCQGRQLLPCLAPSVSQEKGQRLTRAAGEKEAQILTEKLHVVTIAGCNGLRWQAGGNVRAAESGRGMLPCAAANQPSAQVNQDVSFSSNIVRVTQRRPPRCLPVGVTRRAVQHALLASQASVTTPWPGPLSTQPLSVNVVIAHWCGCWKGWAIYSGRRCARAAASGFGCFLLQQTIGRTLV